MSKNKDPSLLQLFFLELKDPQAEIATVVPIIWL